MKQPEYRRTVQTFARDHLVTAERELDALPDAPAEPYRAFAETGLANWWVPKEYGGMGLNLQDSVPLVGDLAYGDAGVAFGLFLSVLTTSMVSLYGSEELAQTYLPELVAGNGFAATLGSEHGAGSELGRTETVARRVGGDVVLDGHKAFSTNADFARFLVVIARAENENAPHMAVLVPRETPGVVVEKRWDMLGVRGSGTYQVRLEGVRVPAGNVLAGHGLRILEVGLNASRLLIAASAVGIARRLRDLGMDYAGARQLKGAAMSTHPVFGAKLGQVEMQIEAMRSQCLAAAAEYDALASRPDAGAAFLRTGTMRSAVAAKMLCGQFGWQIASTASEMFGGLGYTHEMVVGKLVRDMRYVSVVEGGDDVLRDLLFTRFVVPAAKRS